MARKKPQKLLCEIKKNKKQATMWRKIKYGKGCAVAVSELKKNMIVKNCTIPQNIAII